MRMHRLHLGAHRMKRDLALAVVPALVASGTLPLIAGCRPSPETVANGDDPLAALTVSVQSTRYTAAYWHAQATADSARWRRAVDYCRTPGIVADGAKPNCGFVRLAANRLQLDSIRARGIRLERARDQIDRSLFTP